MNPDRPDQSRPEDPDHGLDVEAAFADIVANYGERAPLEPPESEPPADDFLRDSDPWQHRRVLEPRWEDPLDTGASWDDEGHFVPPPPPPLPQVSPGRRAAWVALFGAPLLVLVLYAAGVASAGWFTGLLAMTFIGGFVYLVATMRSDEDRWGGDDGAVI